LLVRASYEIVTPSSAILLNSECIPKSIRRMTNHEAIHAVID